MSDSKVDEMRRKFEAWASADGTDISTHNGGYVHYDTWLQWEAWQAALAACTPAKEEGR